MKLVISPKKILKILLTVIILMSIVSIFGQYSKLYLGNKHFWAIRMFHLDSEYNVPTWLSSSLLVICSLILAAIALLKKQLKDKYAGHWTFLSVIFIYLSIDEAISLHERTIKPLRAYFKTSDFLHFAWVIPGALFVLIIMLSYLGFFKSLSERTRNWFLFSGFIFVSGSLGMELISGHLITLLGPGHPGNMVYTLATSVEEILEMAGASLFIYSLLSYLSPILENVKISIEDVEPAVDDCQLLQLTPSAADITVTANSE